MLLPLFLKQLCLSLSLGYVVLVLIIIVIIILCIILYLLRRASRVRKRNGSRNCFLCALPLLIILQLKQVHTHHVCLLVSCLLFCLFVQTYSFDLQRPNPVGHLNQPTGTFEPVYLDDLGVFLWNYILYIHVCT